MIDNNFKRQPSSFKDPSGFLFWHNNVLYRRVDKSYASNFDLLMSSGLYQELIKRSWLIQHTEIDDIDSDGAYKIIRPEFLNFISYPYEWCFSQLKDAALLTLKIQKIALEHGMILKDASAYNIQFKDGRPILIDTLSFEKYKEGTPWVAYRQFCQHFLAPLALMVYKDVRLGQLLRIHIDGIPLDLASCLLPWKTHFIPNLLFHIHFHARAEKRYRSLSPGVSGGRHYLNKHLNKDTILDLIEGLEDIIYGFEINVGQNQISNNNGVISKKEIEGIIKTYLHEVKPKLVLDLGMNINLDILTVSTDSDYWRVEKIYRNIKTNKEGHILPLIVDFVNPSPSIGWNNEERDSFLSRIKPDIVLAEAHQLAISNNVPLRALAQFFASFAPWLIVEFISKDDLRVQKLFTVREDIFRDYTKERFEAIFQEFFEIKQLKMTGFSFVYLMQRRYQ